MSWERHTFGERVGLGLNAARALNGKEKPAMLGKADIDPATRGMMALLSTATLDGHGGAHDLQVKYWYRRPNGQDKLVHLFDVKTFYDENTNRIEVEEIFYRNKPLLGDLPKEKRDAPREILLDTIRELNTHLREGGSPKQTLKILNERNVDEIIGEDIILPGQNENGNFDFRISDTFNPLARGEITVSANNSLAEAIALGEINTLDAHRRIDGGNRTTYGTNYNTGATFQTETSILRTKQRIKISSDITPVIIPDGVQAKALKGFLKTSWKKLGNSTTNDNGVSLDALEFHGQSFKSTDVDNQLRALGVFYKMIDMIRRRRYPTALDFIHEFDLMDHISPVDPPPPEGRMTTISYLGNGKQEIVEGFGFGLGACKAVNYEWTDDDGTVQRENVILDLGKMLAPFESDADGALPDVLGILKYTKGVFISHRHLDHMGAIIELTRMGVMKDVTIYAAPRVKYILEQQIKAELDDKSLMPSFEILEKEGIVDFDHLSVEYSTDAIDHSTPSTAFRVVGRKTDKTSNLTVDDIKGSYLFYGDGRGVNKPDFLARGLRSFGIDRQDTVLDADLTNAQKPGHAPTEADAEKNIEDLLKCFPDDGLILGLISTNDSRLNTLYKVLNKVGRNFTGVGHNIEMSLRAHNIHGMNPEYIEPHDKDNINQFLKDHAREETNRRTAHLEKKLEKETDPDKKEKLEEQIDDLKITPVEFRGRGSVKAKTWLRNSLDKLAILATGTQGNPAEMFATIPRFAEGWSTLDADRHTAFKISDSRQFRVIIDQSAIPGNEKYQQKMIRKSLKNRNVKSVKVAIDDGFKTYGLDDKSKKAFIENYVTDTERNYYSDADGSIVITGAPIHPSGHGNQKDIAEIAITAQADINHGTHSNDPANTTAFHEEICEKNGLRHLGRQFDDFEYNEIEMGETPEKSQVNRIGSTNASMIVFKIIREFGAFFGGTLQARRITRLDGHDQYGQSGLTAGGTSTQFDNSVVAIDFKKANDHRKATTGDKREPEPAMIAPPVEERRYKGVVMPGGVRIDRSKLDKIREMARMRVA